MNRRIFLAVAAMIWFAAGCENEHKIGLDLLPDEDIVNIYVNDTATVLMQTEYDDSVPALGVNKLLLGDFKDPVFGRTQASFITSFSGNFITNFGENAVVDSVILMLQFVKNERDNEYNDYYYGDPTTPLDLYVYEIDSTFNIDTAFFANQEYTGLYYPNPIGYRHVRNMVADTVIWVRLDDELGLRIMANSFSLPDVFKGVYVKAVAPDDRTGAIYKLDFESEVSNLVMYYHNDNNDSLKSDYAVQLYGKNANFFKHEYPQDIQRQINSNEYTTDSVTYFQTMGGLKIKIKIPYLKAWQKFDDIIINDAELILNAGDESYTNENIYPAVSQAALYLIDSTGRPIGIREYYVSGKYHGEYYADGRIRFNLTRLVQEAIDEGKELEFTLMAFDRAIEFNRTVFATQNNSKPSKLLITYTLNNKQEDD